MIAQYRLTNINYDTDGAQVGLPPGLTIDIDEAGKTPGEIEEELSDAISDRTGFCHTGFNSVRIPNA